MPILVQSEKFLRFKFKISITLISLPMSRIEESQYYYKKRVGFQVFSAHKMRGLYPCGTIGGQKTLLHGKNELSITVNKNGL